MHYCLSSQVGQEYLKKADEIKIKYNKLDSILDLYELNPKVTFILRITKQEDKSQIRWTDIEKYNKMTQNKVIVETDDFDIMDACKVIDVKFFYAIPINNFYDLKALADYGCCDVRIDAPLTHMIDRFENIDITVRMTPNVAYYAYIPRENGIIGSWVRPEDVEIYEEYVDVFEFEDCDAKREEALYRVYAEQKSWPSNLNNLISNLNCNTDNKLILPDLAKIRSICGQKCAMGINCSACHRMLNLANNEKIRKFVEKKDKVVQ